MDKRNEGDDEGGALSKLVQPAAFATAAYFVLTPALGVGGALSSPVALCLAGAAAIRPSLVRQVIEKKPTPVLLLLALTVWVMASTAWSPLPMDDQAYKLAIIVPLGLMFVASATADAQARRLTMAGALAAFVILALLLAIEAIWTLPLNRIAQPSEPVDQLGRNVSRGATVLLALAWGAVGGLVALGGRTRLAAAALILIAGGALSLQFGQLANAVAFALGLMAMGAAFVAPRLMLLATSGGLAAWVLTAPFITPVILSNQKLVDALPLSWASRGGIWTYVCARIVEQPWIGHGLEASRAVTERVEVRGISMLALPLHPHSASLQIWYETGAVGALLAATALISGGVWLVRKLGDDRPAAAAACGTLAFLGVIANVSFGLWAEWWIATMFMAAAAVGATRAAR